MNSKFGDWAIRIFAILYGCICIGLIIYDCTMNKQPQKEKECILNIVFENQTSYKDITICMIEKIKQEENFDKRNELIEQALLRVNKNIYVLPLHTQVINWALKKNIEAPLRADDRLELDKVIVK